MARQMQSDADRERVTIGSITAESVTYHGRLPDFAVFNAVCAASQRTIEAVEPAAGRRVNSEDAA